MTVPERYKDTKSLEEQRSLQIAEGVDSVTGLPVLIYRFEGESETGLEGFESDNAPRVLWLGREGTTTGLVVALEPGWRYRRSENGSLRPSELLELTRALRDAAAVQLVHGDIRPERLLVAGSGLQIEGFGVPWVPERGPFTAPEIDGTPTLAGDVWSLEAVIRKFGTTALDDTTAAVLELCAAENPGERPTAEELHLALERLIPEAESAAESSVEPASTEEAVTEEADASAVGRSTVDEGAVGEGAVGEGADENGTAEGNFEEGRPEQENRPFAATVAGDSAKGSASEISRASEGGTDPRWDVASGAGTPLPPDDGPDIGAPSSQGAESSDDGDMRRRLALLGVLMAAVILLALLAVFGPRPGADPALGRDATVYVVEFAVAPEDLPPVTIHLVSSPPGSSLSRGERLGTAPRHLALERGTWVFQGSLQDRRSEPVEVRVPEQRSITLTIPPSPSAEDR